MEIQIREEQGATLIRPMGKLTIVEGATVVYDAVKPSLEAGAKTVILDMGAMPYMDSTGLGQLISIRQAVVNAGAVLRLAGVNDKIKELLSITRLDSVFTVYDTVDAALAAS